MSSTESDRSEPPERGTSGLALAVPFRDRQGHVRNMQVATSGEEDLAITIPTGVAEMKQHQVGLLIEAIDRVSEAT